jgi:hypothetical protein
MPPSPGAGALHAQAHSTVDNSPSSNTGEPKVPIVGIGIKIVRGGRFRDEDRDPASSRSKHTVVVIHKQVLWNRAKSLFWCALSIAPPFFS